MHARVRSFLCAGLYVLAALVLSSCTALNVGSVHVAYEHADWLLQHMAERYVDFDPRQAEAVHTGFGKLHTWHRAQELPLYADLMDTAAARTERGLKREDIAWLQRSIYERWQATSRRLAGEMTPVLVSLTPAQISQIERKLAEDNAKFAKTQVSSDIRKSDKHRYEWLVEQITRWTGDLNAVQKQRIELAVKQTEDFPALRLAERKRRQAEFLQLVRGTHDQQTLRVALTEMLATPREGADDAYRRSAVRYEEQMTQMILDLDKTLSTQQRATAAERMRRYAQSFRAMALGRT